MGAIKKITKKVVDPLGLFDKPAAAPDTATSDAQAGALAAQARATEESNRIAADTKRYQDELLAVQRETANREAAARAEANAAQLRQTNMTTNYGANLTLENRAMVEAGGSAEEAAAVDNPDQKRRRPSGGLASTLGISV